MKFSTCIFALVTMAAITCTSRATKTTSLRKTSADRSQRLLLTEEPDAAACLQAMNVSSINLEDIYKKHRDAACDYPDCIHMMDVGAADCDGSTCEEGWAANYKYWRMHCNGVRKPMRGCTEEEKDTIKRVLKGAYTKSEFRHCYPDDTAYTGTHGGKSYDLTDYTAKIESSLCRAECTDLQKALFEKLPLCYDEGEGGGVWNRISKLDCAPEEIQGYMTDGDKS